MSPGVRLTLLLLGASCLAIGVAGGLARLGLPFQVPAAAAFHGAIMTTGFLGTVISLERAVALGGRWAYAVPLAAALGALLPLAGLHAAGAVLWLAAPLGLFAASIAIVRRQAQAHTVLLAVAALAWAVGNAIYPTTWTAAAPAWWFAFLVLTIAAERLEMTRLTRRPAIAAPLFLAIVALLLAGAAASLAEGRVGQLAYGAGLVALAAWLAVFDIARHTVKAQGFARYAAVALLSGYAWLAVAGAAWAIGTSRDIALHALGLGFVFSMIFAHAPLIVPVVLKRAVRFTALAYGPLALLHASLLLRFAGAAGEGALRAWGGALNAAAIVAFAAIVVASSGRRATQGQAPGAGAPRFTLWALGFRPFYLAASAFAALSVALWALQYSGAFGAAALRGPAWHGHEMIFGYAFAVIAGFLLTAVRNWTQRDTPAGAALAAIVLLWVAGRVLVLTPYALAAAVVNALFPLAVAVGIGIPLVASGNRRNYFFVALLAGASVAVLVFHLAAAGLVAWPPRVGLQAGLDLVLFIVAVIAGRVIPMFTNNGVPGAEASRRPWVERACLAGVLALLALDVAGIDGAPLALVALAAAVAHGIRLALWHPWRTLRTPLVWVLHAAYAWIVVHLALRALAQWGLVPEPLATHALTIGVIGGMTIGMMTRTARGHTGRPLVADRYEVTCYALVQAAALARVGGALLLPAAYLETVWVSAACWSAAFALYAVRYWPVLTRPRLDGKPG